MLAPLSLQIGEIYAVAIGSILVLCVGWKIAASLHQLRHRLTALARKYSDQTLVTRRRNGSSDVTIAEAVSVGAVAAANIVATCVDVRTTNQLAHRLGTLALTNLVPMYFGRTSFWTNICGMSHRRHGVMHRWLGRIFILQALAHSLLRLSANVWTFSVLHMVVSQSHIS